MRIGDLFDFTRWWDWSSNLPFSLTNVQVDTDNFWYLYHWLNKSDFFISHTVIYFTAKNIHHWKQLLSIVLLRYISCNRVTHLSHLIIILVISYDSYEDGYSFLLFWIFLCHSTDSSCVRILADIRDIITNRVNYIWVCI